MPTSYDFVADLFEWEGNGAWHFVALPAPLADEIEATAQTKGGFGSVPVEVTVGATTWQTSLFPDRSRGTYLLPVKRAVRVAEDWYAGDSVGITLVLRGQQP
jgi:hypothetical protein